MNIRRAAAAVILAISLLLSFSCLPKKTLFDPEKSEALDKLLTDLYEKRQFNGVVLAAQNGNIILKKAYGYANFENGTLLTTKTPFYMASVAKQFTAMCIMILVEKGKLDYDDLVVEYLPGLPYKDVTIRHLLHHTGGLQDYPGLVETYNWDTSEIFDNNDLIAVLKKHKPKPLFKAGTGFRYSNTGYVLLASIIENVSGRPYGVFLKENIFDPLDMRNSFACNMNMERCPQERAMGYAIDEKTYEPYDLTFMDGVMGDGNVYCSVEDMFKWDQALYTKKLVKKSTLKLAFTPGRLTDGRSTGYGFGWHIASNGNVVRHGGSWRAFKTLIRRNISAKSTLIFMDNSTTMYRRRIAANILSCLKGNSQEKAKKENLKR